ncbi:MAG: DMT family transporter, partial [Aeromonas veronii]
LLPVAAALFWACYSLMVRYQAANESSHTIVVYLLIFSTPFNVMLALPEWQWPSESQWLLVAASGVLTALAQMSIVRAYSVAEASFVQPFDFAKLPMNVLAGWLVFGWAPPGRLWLGAAIIIGAITLLTHLEQRAHKPVS